MEQQFSINVVTGGFILENYQTGKREIFTSENKLIKAIKDMLKDVPQNSSEAEDVK